MNNWLTPPCHLLLASLLFLLANESESSPLFRGKGLPYITSDLKELSGKSFDYIIVGGGTTGCPLAATLSEKHSVLVVERGGSPYGNPLVLDKKYLGTLMYQTDEFSSLAQSFVSEDGVGNRRGRVLGGSSAINEGFYSRASRDFIRKVGWDKGLVKEAYKWVESMIVYKPHQLTQWQAVLKNAYLEAGFRPYNRFSWEHVEGTKIGGAIFDKFGTRHSLADLLQAGNPGNITVLLNATVKSVIFHKHGNEKEIIAKGIRFINSNGSTNQIYKAYLNQQRKKTPVGDVILSAGALGSPQILMLSGIGPEKNLKNLGILLVLDLKGVGQEMKDNPGIAMLLDTKAEYRVPDTPQVVGISKDFRYIVEGGILPVSSNKTMKQIAMKVAFPESKGKLEIRSTDPRQNPSVRFNYLSKETDLNECAEMVQVLQRVTSSISAPMPPRAETQDNKSNVDELKSFCKKNVTTYYHYHGGCTMGSVVDNDYRVYGVKRLRVIDGSTFPESPGTNPMATCLMLGRYQGIRILRETEHY